MTILVTCSGLSNTGKLTTQVAVALMRHYPGTLEWVRAGAGPDRLRQVAGTADQVIEVNGCPDCCAGKKLREIGVVPHSVVITTDLGITKNGMDDPAYAEIGLVVETVREILASGSSTEEAR
jgi:uncharacterized metal-binding protein